MQLCTKFERNRTIRGAVIAIGITLWPWTRVTCSDVLWDNFNKV